MGHLLYFACDELMDDAVLGRIAPGSECFGRTRLAEHTLALEESGELTLLPKPNATVWGVLWLVPAEHQNALDAFYGAPTGPAQRTTVRVVTPGGPPAQALHYRRSPKASTSSARRTDWPGILRAARVHDLPDDYQRHLLSLADQATKLSR